MYIATKSAKQLYNEKEAAEALGISLPALHAILDEHIFNQGAPRPESIEFTASDLLMLGYWAESTDQQKASAVSGN